MFAVTVTFDIHPDCLDAFMPLMIENARASRNQEPGCQQFDVCQNGTRIFLYEIYDDAAAFDAHLATDHFKRFNAAVTDMVQHRDLKTYEHVKR